MNEANSTNLYLNYITFLLYFFYITIFDIKLIELSTILKEPTINYWHEGCICTQLNISFEASYPAVQMAL